MLVKKIDIHNHVVMKKGTPRFYSAKLGDWLTPEETFRFFDLQGIELGVQLPFISPGMGLPHHLQRRGDGTFPPLPRPSCMVLQR